MAFRIVQARHAASAFSGKGASIAGGRWNSPGKAVVYCAGSYTLALLEVMASIPDQAQLRRYVWFETELPEAGIQRVSAQELRKNWHTNPVPPSTQRIGDEWLEAGRSLALAVPSAATWFEDNYLLNPAHPDFGELKFVGPKRCRVDPRLLRDKPKR